jgi:PAS domain S-box-containing protein
MNPVSILIVEDQVIIAEDLKGMLISLGCQVSGIAATGDEAIAWVTAAPPDLILMDINLGDNGIDGIETAKRILAQVFVPIIYLTGYSDSALLERAKASGPYGYILKPFDIRKISIAIEIALVRYEKDVEIRKAYRELEEHEARWTGELLALNQNLRESEERYREIFEGTPDGIIVHDANGVILDANETTTKRLEIPRAALCGRHLADFVTPDNAVTIDHHAARSLDGQSEVFETAYVSASGKTIPAEVHERSIPWKDGQAVLSVSRDITKRRRAEKAARESRQILKAVLNNIPARVFWKDKNLVYLGCNPSLARDAGFSCPDDIIGLDDYALGWMEQAGRYRDDDRTVIADGVPKILYEEPQTTPSGKIVHLLTSKVPLRDDKGDIIGVLGTYVDITERRQMEEALRKSEERYRTVVEDQTEFICRFSPDGRLTFVNEAYCRYFGLDKQTCIGSPQKVVIPREDLGRLKKHLSAFTPENPVAVIEHRVILPSGEMRWQRWSDRAIFDEFGRITEYQSVGRDITEEKAVGTELKNYRENLEKEVRVRTAELTRTNRQLVKEIDERKVIDKKLVISSNEKDLLLREIHHRVKNNLQLISGLLDMTKMRTQDPELVSTLTDVMLRVQTMAQIHTRLYESKRFDRVDMDQQIQDQMAALSDIYAHNDRDVTYKIECSGIYLPVDQAIPCALVLNEILSNSYKHAFRGRTHGTVVVTVRKADDRLRFIVRDNGVGIPRGFDINLANRLGLKLIRTLVRQQLKGIITVKRVKGTEVIIEFPIHTLEKGHVENTYC